jgi:hypothetical protein
LSRDLSLRVEEATQLPNQNDTNTEEKEVSQGELVSMRGSLEEQGKAEQGRLRKVKEKASGKSLVVLLLWFGTTGVMYKLGRPGVLFVVDCCSERMGGTG